MKVLYKKDIPGGYVWGRKMPNGETRVQMRLDSGLMSVFTYGNTWKWSDGIPWQQCHSHKGLFEQYVIVKGWAIFYTPLEYKRKSKEYRYELTTLKAKSEQKTILFVPNTPHTVLLGPESIMHTVSWGDTKKHLNKEGFDWWPADPRAQESVVSISSRVLRDLVKKTSK